MDTVTQGNKGAGARRSSRQEALNLIEERRVNEVNKELEEAGSTERVTHVPTQLDGLASEDDDDPEAKAARLEREEAEAKRLADEEAARKAAAGEDNKAGDELKDVKTDDGGQDIYEFLGEDRIGKTKVKIKVDGKDEEIVVGDVLRDVQKLRAADKRLEDASLTKKRAEQDAKEIRERAEAEAAEIKERAVQEAAAGTKKEDKSPSVPDAIREAVSHLYEGDQEKASEALAKAISSSRGGEAVDEQKITAAVERNIVWKTTLDQFSADHKDIVSDPYLLGMWQGHLDEAAKTLAPAEAVKKATELTTSWLGKVSGNAGGSKVTTDETALAKRRADKEAAARHSVTSSTTTRAPSTDKEQKLPTSADTVAEMKKARGQA